MHVNCEPNITIAGTRALEKKYFGDRGIVNIIGKKTSLEFLVCLDIFAMLIKIVL